MKISRALSALLLFTVLFTACKKDNDPRPEPELSKPTIDNIEIGLSNNEIGVIGKDFHFNADILAGDKIADVQVKITQLSGETYSKEWSHEITWDQYKGAKNANVHKHFTIPEDAAEGKYDFLIVINDENGTKLEVKKSITLYTEANLPVNPTGSIFNLMKGGLPFYRNGAFTAPGSSLKKGDEISSQVTIGNVKGDGKMYILLINKTQNHRPESIDKIDFSKVIVYDEYEHKDWATTDFFSNVIFDLETFTVVRDAPKLKIDATVGDKTMESGTYYFGVVYKNTTYNMGYFNYIEVPVEIN